MISNTFSHVQLLFFFSKRVSGKWKVQRYLNKYFSPCAICLVACTILKRIGSTLQRPPAMHSFAAALVQKAKQWMIGVSRLSLSEVASQSRISGAGQHSFQLFPSKRQISASQIFHLHQSAQTTSARILRLKSTDVKKTAQTRKQPSWVLFSISWKHYKSQSHSRYSSHCFHIYEQNKTPSCMLWYQTVKQAFFSGILKYQ